MRWSLPPRATEFLFASLRFPDPWQLKFAPQVNEKWKPATDNDRYLPYSELQSQHGFLLDLAVLDLLPSKGQKHQAQPEPSLHRQALPSICGCRYFPPHRVHDEFQQCPSGE